MIHWKTKRQTISTTAKECYESLKICEPLRTIDKKNRPKHLKNYQIWEK